MKTALRVVTILGLATVGLPAYADDQVNAGEERPPETAEPAAQQPPNDGDLPTPRSDSDPAPEVASPGVPPGGIVKQAGVGGVTGYGRAGVLELGGSAGMTFASDFSQISVAPSIGWFLADNFQISLIGDLTHVDTGDNDGTLFSALVEPSYHIPFNRVMFGFFGLGLGGSYLEDLGGGFAMAPRLGANVLVGRSGVLTPSVSWQYTTHDLEDEGDGDGMAIVAVSSALRFNVGYTVMW